MQQKGCVLLSDAAAAVLYSSRWKRKQSSPTPHPTSPASRRSGLHSAYTIKSSWVLRLSETKVLKFSPPPMAILFTYFLSLNQTGSGRLGPLSHMVINCLVLRLKFPGDVNSSCKVLRQYLVLVLQSFMLWRPSPEPPERASERERQGERER